MKKALIIFVRNPVPGKVKTRIAKTAGEQKALAIYIQLLQHTQQITHAVETDKFVFYADQIEQQDLWQHGYSKLLQIGDDLGEKMKNAFDFLFREGYENVCIIGSDCIELSAAIIEDAFDMLLHNDVVIGPSEDGGYYLLGLKAFRHILFEGIAWSTEKVLKQTLEKCVNEKLRYELLDTLNDIDDEADWQRYLKPTANMKDGVLIFVYNSGSNIWNTAIDYLHKVISPSTYGCSLCALTHTNFGMKKEWKTFTSSINYEKLFIHKDDFVELYPTLRMHPLPAIFLQRVSSVTPLVSADELNRLSSLSALMDALSIKLADL